MFVQYFYPRDFDHQNEDANPLSGALYTHTDTHFCLTISIHHILQDKMSGAAVDAAFVISLEEQSYREEEEMRKEAEAEGLKRQTDKILVAGDAKKGASLFKVRPGYTPYFSCMLLTLR